MSNSSENITKGNVYVISIGDKDFTFQRLLLENLMSQAFKELFVIIFHIS